MDGDHGQALATGFRHARRIVLDARRQRKAGLFAARAGR
jgi:hypothetical protein